MTHRAYRFMLVAASVLVAPLTASSQSAVAPASTRDAQAAAIEALFDHASRGQPDIQRLSLAIHARQTRMLANGAALESVRADLADTRAASAALARVLEDADARANPDDRQAGSALRRIIETRRAAALERERALRIREQELADEIHADALAWRSLTERLTVLTIPPAISGPR